ncbi:MAG: hypothetical protein ACREBE_13620 [bacterium]
MFRTTTLLVASLFVLAACDGTRSTGPVTPGVVNVDPGANRHGIRGILRRAMDVPDTEWQLELVDGSMLRLIGGPEQEIFAGLENQEVFVIGHTTDVENTLVVESCELDTQIYLEFNLRPSARRR